MSLEKPDKPEPSTENAATDNQNTLHIPLPVTTTQRSMRAKHNGPVNNTGTKLYVSRIIDDSNKPTHKSKIILSPDLETLRPLIMSQPEVSAPYIIELGTNNLTH